MRERQSERKTEREKEREREIEKESNRMLPKQEATHIRVGVDCALRELFADGADKVEQDERPHARQL